ncbi:MAG TPA: hypothetical protein ENN13_00760 [Candidatus Altiarchaeales archaeon]|nr:hypothetical protein [Candidatus Altiarchaeales archaeon]
MAGADYNTSRWVEDKTLLLEWADEKWPEILNKRSVENDRAYHLIENTLQVLESLLYGTALNPKCPLNCASACCFFSEKEGVKIPLELSKLKEISEYVKNTGGKTEDYLELKPVAELPLIMKSQVENPTPGYEYVTKRHGLDMVYLLKTNPDFIAAGFTENIPLVSPGRKMRLDETHKACVFLTKDGLCSLHEKGIKPIVCTTYMCFTSYALNLLYLMGYLTDESLKGNDFELLNKAAVKADEIFSLKEFQEIDVKRDDAFKDLVSAFISGAGLDEKTVTFEKASEKYYEKRRYLLEPVMLILGA